MLISMKLKKAPSNVGMIMSGTATAGGLRMYYGSFVAGGDTSGDPASSPPGLAIGPYTAPAVQAFGAIAGAAPNSTDPAGNITIANLISAGGADIVIPGSITYMVSAAIVIPTGKTVRAATGTSVTIKASAGYAGHIFTMTTCQNSALKNVTVDGNWVNRSAREAAADAGVMITGGSANVVEHVSFTNMPSYGIWEYNSRMVDFKYNNFNEVYHPIRIDGNSLSNGGSITYNNFFNTSAFKSIQSLEMINTRDIYVMHNFFEGAGRQVPTTHGFEGTWGNSIYIFNSSNYWIENNTCLKSYWSSCVVGQDSHHVTVTRNLFSSGNHSGSTGGLQAFWFEQASADYLTLSRNIFNGGVSLGDTGGNHATVEDNQINTESVGIDVNFGCDHAIIQRNTFNRVANSINGVFLWEKRAMPTDVKVQNNIFNGFNIGVAANNSAGTGAIFGLTITGNVFSACNTTVSMAVSVNLATCTIQGTNQSGSVTAGDVSMATHVNQFIHAGNWEDAYWIESNPWGAAGMVLGSYSSAAGSSYELTTGTTRIIGTSGEIAARLAWKFPVGSAAASEIKAYPSILKGYKPGYYNTGPTPGGLGVIQTDGVTATSAPSGGTPGSFFPLALPIGSLNATCVYSHMAAPTGLGQLTYDIWLQNSPTQINGFSAPPITYEIMIPLNYWGGYGAYPTRNPSWYDHDATIDGRLWHVYWAPNFNGSWKFIVFEPDTASIAPATLNLKTFINYGLTHTDSAAPSTMWISSGQYCVSVELGVEPQNGTGDIFIQNYRLYQP